MKKIVRYAAFVGFVALFLVSRNPACVSQSIATAAQIAVESSSAATDPTINIMNIRTNRPGTLTTDTNPATSPTYESLNYEFKPVEYTVRWGDKLEHIARRHSSKMYKMSVDEIVKLNGIKNRDYIRAGSTLKLQAYYAKEVKAAVPAIVHAAIVPEKAARADSEKEKMWLIFGLIAAVIGMFLVTWQSLKLADKVIKQKQTNGTPLERVQKIIAEEFAGNDVLALKEWRVVNSDPSRDAWVKFGNLDKLVEKKNFHDTAVKDFTPSHITEPEGAKVASETPAKSGFQGQGPDF